MGTLTADCPRLDAHCDHKLATSCRLTSTPNCCACADARAHSLTYRVYIDGIGFVQRGTRWQGYCWFCKGISSKERQTTRSLTALRILDQSPRCHRASTRNLANTHTRDPRSEGISRSLVRIPSGVPNCDAPRRHRTAHCSHWRTSA
jgi:hypothetical protein